MRERPAGGGSNRVHILLVQDDPGDLLYTREVLAEHRVANPLSVLSDARDALAWARGDGPYRGRPFPELVLLDLAMPGGGGRLVLDAVRAQPALAGTTVAVLVASAAEEQILRAHGTAADHYLTKPVDFAALARLVAASTGLALVVERPPDRMREPH